MFLSPTSCKDFPCGVCYPEPHLSPTTWTVESLRQSQRHQFWFGRFENIIWNIITF
jgi:hypothetical protein